MTTPPEIERKVRQLDNDVHSIYDLLADLHVGVKKVQASQLRQGSRLDQIEDRLTGVDNRLTGVEDRLTGVDNRLTGVEDRLVGVDGKLDSVLDLLRRDRPTED